MTREYKVTVNSSKSAQVADISLAAPEEEPTARTRRIARVKLVDNYKNPEAAVHVCLMHQRRATATAPWEDADSFVLRKLKAGEQVRIELHSEEVARLYAALSELYAISGAGFPGEMLRLDGHIILRVPPYEKKYLVLDIEQTHLTTDENKETLLKLLSQQGKEVFELVAELEPQIFEAYAAARTHRIRREAVDTFARELERSTWSEQAWDDFFKLHKWIFGHGLDYRFLSEIQSQAHYGGLLVSGRGGQRGDYLMATQAQNRFTVLVEIKKPNSELVTKDLYRNKVHKLGEELTGGISQLQSNCRTWVIEGSRSDENRDYLESTNTYTYEPKGILVIGHTRQLDTTNKRATFEMFRRNLHNPQILTFDELLERARFVVSHDESVTEDLESKQQASEVNSMDFDPGDLDVDDIPF